MQLRQDLTNGTKSRYIHIRFAILDLPSAFYSIFGDRSCPHCKRAISSFPHLVQHVPVGQGQTGGAQPASSVKGNVDGEVKG